MVLTQEALPMVALASMNDTHLEDLIMINELAELIKEKNVEQTGEKLEIMVAHTVEHFAAEERMMLEKHFPAYPMHKNEHDRALAELIDVVESWKREKDFTELRNYIEEVMPVWLVQHVSTMDTVTAAFLVS